MKTRTLTMAALAASVALGLAAQAHGQVVYPKVVFDVTGGAGTIDLSKTSGDKGTTVSFTATLNISLLGTQVAGTQNDITFDPANAPVAATSKGKPDCTVNDAIDKSATSFAFQPPNCTGSACTGMRAIVLSTANTDPIPSGSVLYTCNVAISSSAANGTYLLKISNILGSDPSGKSVPLGGTDGAVTVPGAQTPTPTVIITPTHGGSPSATSTRTRIIPPTGGGRGNDDDACAIVSPATSSAGWMLVFPAALLLWVRRRSR